MARLSRCPVNYVHDVELRLECTSSSRNMRVLVSCVMLAATFASLVSGHRLGGDNSNTIRKLPRSYTDFSVCWRHCFLIGSCGCSLPVVLVHPHPRLRSVHSMRREECCQRGVRPVNSGVASRSISVSPAFVADGLRCFSWSCHKGVYICFTPNKHEEQIVTELLWRCGENCLRICDGSGSDGLQALDAAVLILAETAGFF